VFSPRSSKKRSKERKRGARKRSGKNLIEHGGGNNNNNNNNNSNNNNTNKNDTSNNSNNNVNTDNGNDTESAGSSSSVGPGRTERKNVVEYVLPGVLAQKVSSGEVQIDPNKLADFVKKMGRQEYKAIVKSCRAPRSWAEKLQQFPGATSYFAYAKNRYRDVLADEKTRVFFRA
jgi:hypothetical protein